MPWIEVSHWLAGESDDLSSPRSWAPERHSPEFPHTALAEAALIVAEPAVRASAMDLAPEPVVGLVEGRDALTAFCFQAVSYGQVALWIASAGSAIRGYDLVRLWSWVVTTGRVAEFKWSMPVDTSALHKPVLENPPSIPARFVFSDRRVAIRAADDQRRLYVCCHLLGRLHRSKPQSFRQRLVLVDNLTVVSGDTIDVAGLVPSHRFTATNWRIVDLTPASLLDEALHRFCNRVDVAFDKVRAARDSDVDVPIDDQAHASRVEQAPRKSDMESMQVVGFAALRAACDAIAQAIDKSISRGKASAQEIFEVPARAAADDDLELLTFAAFDGSTASMIARALIVGRFPAVAFDARTTLSAWLDAMESLDVWLNTLAVAEAVQPAYDHCRLAGREADLAPIAARLDRLVERLLERIEGHVSDDFSTWTSDDRRALADVFDKLGEMETTRSQLDRQLARANALMRLALGLPTPDVIDRAVRVALRENSAGVSGLISRNLPSDTLTEIGSIALCDMQGQTTLQRSRELFDKLFIGQGSGQADGRRSQPAGAAAAGGQGVSIFRSFYGGEVDAGAATNSAAR
jgi:hypothetical protein